MRVKKIDARAFTVGNHVAFNRGEYDPESAEGQHVIAHELAHVRQQTGGAVSMLPQEGVQIELDSLSDRQTAAQRVVEGRTLNMQCLKQTDVHIQRAKEDDTDTNTAKHDIEERPDIEVE